MSGSVDQYSLILFSEKMTIEDFEVAYKVNADLFLIAKSGRNTGMVKNHPEFIFYLQQIGHIL